VSDPRSTTETSLEAEVSADETNDVDRSPELLLAVYGDDLTGSTAVLEALAKNGVRTALFFDPPTPDELTGRFADLAAVGVAGRSRSMTPSQMNERLAPAFEALRALDPECCHYKVCTTFDSSPEIGSIGHAIDLGQDSFDSPFVPLLIGNPPLEPLGRYVVFGNLFATQDGEVYRLDRHPTMSNHPVTPMAESDLRRHLRRQTDRDIGLVDVLDMWGDPAAALERERSDAEVVLFDTLRRAHLDVAGRLLWSEAEATDGPLFAVGSSAVEYALTGRWQENGRVPDRDRRGQVDAVDRLLVMSGSAAPVTAEQIDRAVGAGFADVRLESGALVDPDGAADARERAVSAAATALENDRSVVLYSARGPEDPVIAETRARAADLGVDAGERLGVQQGRIVREVLDSVSVPRVCVAGGDTSGAVCDELGIHALERLAPIVPGNPLCRATFPEADVDGLEVILKGGQVGPRNYFERVRRGRTHD
jgi:uncharacterized protein YgbK (DUF1537 family)